jgi:ATP-dependent HslUV protease ATP-binding subunit HslU
MPIYLPGAKTAKQDAELGSMLESELTPRQIVAELDKFIIGQPEAKRAVAIALRNRMRRRKLTPDMAEEVLPKNILMIGPTGVGKTEVARRLARLANAPFVKVEASKYTEVGYVGRDVESMIRDLMETSIEMVRDEKLEEISERAELNAEERLLDMLLPPPLPTPPAVPASPGGDGQPSQEDRKESFQKTREKIRGQLRAGALDDRMVELDVRERNFPSFEIISNQGIEEMDINVKDMLPGLFGRSAETQAQDESL